VSDYGLNERAIVVRFPTETRRVIPLASVSRPALRLTHVPVQWVPGVLSTGIMRGRGVTLTTQSHLVPRSWMSRSDTPSPPLRLHRCVVGLLYLLHLLHPYRLHLLTSILIAMVLLTVTVTVTVIETRWDRTRHPMHWDHFWSNVSPHLSSNHSLFIHQSSQTITSRLPVVKQEQLGAKWPLNFAYEVSLFTPVRFFNMSFNIATCKRRLYFPSEESRVMDF
jgi:hypothetical protein